MKKKMILASFAAAALLAGPAWAEHGGDHGGPGKDGAPGKYMEKVDTNKDGQVSKDEFMKLQEERFTAMDKDGNGQVTQEEFEAKRAEMREKMKERRKAWREKHKADGGEAAPPEVAPPEAPPAGE